jgi:hypothetical protein
LGDAFTAFTPANGLTTTGFCSVDLGRTVPLGVSLTPEGRRSSSDLPAMKLVSTLPFFVMTIERSNLKGVLTLGARVSFHGAHTKRSGQYCTLTNTFVKQVVIHHAIHFA